MPIQSMTGFSRSQGTKTIGEDQAFDWIWELRSVNGKSLDARFRIPNGHEKLEPEFKALFPKYFSRGNIQASLTLATQGNQVKPRINQHVIAPLLEAAQELQAKNKGASLSIDGLFAIKGVVEYEESGLLEAEKAELNKALLEGLKEALSALKGGRILEGDAVTKVLKSQIKEIGSIAAKIKLDPSRTAEAIKDRLEDQVGKLLDKHQSLDEDRLYQEAAILATKSDLREELDRLEAHVIAANTLLESAGPVGRKLDFLSQEFNRECNTICSKSNSTPVTKYGLEMKVVIDQLREQTQNLE